LTGDTFTGDVAIERNGNATLNLNSTTSGLGNFNITSVVSGNRNYLTIGEETGGDFITIMSDDNGAGANAGNIGIGGITSPKHKIHNGGGTQSRSVYIGDAGVDFSDRGAAGDNLYIRQPNKTTGGWWGSRVEINDASAHTASFLAYEYIDMEGGASSVRKFGVNKDGFTQLGEDAPAIKYKKLTGTTPSTEGGTLTVTHGLTSTKIISIDAIVYIDAGVTPIPPNMSFGVVGVEYALRAGTTGIAFYNHPTNSENILSKPFTVLITYEE
jgi:hypothetical protein